MKQHRHGLVAGRFAPLHAGHTRLIAAAVAACDRVSVQVVSRADEEIPVAVRVGWLRELHPDVEIVVSPFLLGDDQSDPTWRRAYAPRMASLVPTDVDAVFTMHDGPDFAKMTGATWVPIDQGQQVVPVSSSQVRVAPERYWSLLPPPVRSWYVRRIMVVGSRPAPDRSPDLAPALADALGCSLASSVTTGSIPVVGPDEPRPGAERMSRLRADFADAARAASATTPVQWLVCGYDAGLIARWGLTMAEVGDAVGAAGVPVFPVADGALARLYVLDAGERAPGAMPGAATAGVLSGTEPTARLRDELVGLDLPWIEVAGTVEERVAQVLARLPERRLHPLLHP